MPRGAPKKAVAPGPQVLKPQGKGTKRTPQSSFDAAAGKDVYEPENDGCRCDPSSSAACHRAASGGEKGGGGGCRPREGLEKYF